MVTASEGLSAEQSRELEALFGSRISKLLKWGAIFFGLILTVIVFSVSFTPRETISADLLQAQISLTKSSRTWGYELLTSFNTQQLWLQRHGLLLELALFEKLGSVLFSSAAILPFEREHVGILPATFISFHFVCLRVVFLFLACWRFWLAVAILGALYARFRIHTHKGADLLGQTSNGRMFYSGLRAHLDQIDERGAPAQLVSGLACPRSASKDTIESSELYALLEDYGALNETNRCLVGIVLYYSSVPGFLNDREEARANEDAWSKLPLPEYAEHWLISALRLHARLHELAEAKSDEDNEGFEPEGAFETSISSALERVLTTKLKQQISQLPASMIATLVLAHQAAKVMAYGFEGSRWIIKSRFPELAARAIVHSLPAFAVNYEPLQRGWLRRALVFASRRSVFAPVRMPVDLSLETKALRNWSELLLSSPQRLTLAADEIELVALLDEIHERWNAFFFEAIQRQDDRLVNTAYASRSNLLFLSVQGLVEVFGTFVKPHELERLSALATFVAQKNKIDSLALPTLEENSSESRYFEKLPIPIGFIEIKELSRRHHLAEDVIQRWSTYRMILHTYGWLARRVGQHTVPDSSLIFAVFEKEGSTAQRDGEVRMGSLIGRSSMVPIRGSRLVNRWGTSWNRSFLLVGPASMAVTKEDFDRLMRGETKPIPEDLSAVSS